MNKFSKKSLYVIPALFVIVFSLFLFILSLDFVQMPNHSVQSAINNKDSWLQMGSPDMSHGISTTLHYYERSDCRYIIISNFTLPQGSGQIIEVTFNLFIYEAEDGYPTKKAELHELLEDFEEDYVNWNDRASGITWNTPGAMPPHSANPTVADAIVPVVGTPSNPARNSWYLMGEKADNSLDLTWGDSVAFIILSEASQAWAGFRAVSKDAGSNSPFRGAYYYKPYINITYIGEAPTRYVSVTFDDGLQSQFDNAIPVLNELGIHATFFVIYDFISESVPENGYMNWAEVISISKNHEIGCHTKTHPHLNRLSLSQLNDEILAPKQLAFNKYDICFTSFCYPYGEGFDNSTVRQKIEEAGFEYARSLFPSKPWARLRGERYDIKAYDISNDTTLEKFSTIVRQASVYRMVCINYHDIGVVEGLSLDGFKAQMKYLVENGYTFVTTSGRIYSSRDYYAYISHGPAFVSSVEYFTANETYKNEILGTGAATFKAYWPVMKDSMKLKIDNRIILDIRDYYDNKTNIVMLEINPMNEAMISLFVSTE